MNKLSPNGIPRSDLAVVSGAALNNGHLVHLLVSTRELSILRV